MLNMRGAVGVVRFCDWGNYNVGMSTKVEE